MKANSELPFELWARIFELLRGQELWLCAQVCSLWRREVESIVLRGKLGRRHLTCSRLTYHPGDDALEHRKAVRNSLSVSVDKEVLLQGVNTYTGEDANTLDETVPVRRGAFENDIFLDQIVFDRGTTLLSVYQV